MRKLRTVIIEDDAIFRQLMRSTLGRAKDVELIGEFALGQPGLDFCLQKKPDLLVVDLVLPDLHGLKIAAAIRRAAPEILILVITAHPSTRLPAELLALGVSGYVDKTEPIAFVLDAIETVRAGGMYFVTHVGGKPASVASVIDRPAIDCALSPREQQVARLVAAGQVSKEIASTLALGVRTVEKHRRNVMQKAGVHEVASLTRWCIQVGLIEP